MKVNHVIRTMVLSDFYMNGGLSFFGPIFAVFVTQQIEGGTLQVVGYGAAIAQMCKSVFQIPIAKYLDKNHGEYDDFYSVVIGSFLMAMTPFLYLLANAPHHIYIIQGLFGLGLAFGIPPWNAIFSRHLDKLHENFEWSLSSIAIGISAAGGAALGGIIAQKFDFKYVFLIGGVIAVLGSIEIIKIFGDLKEKVGIGKIIPVPDKAL